MSQDPRRLLTLRFFDLAQVANFDYEGDYAQCVNNTLCCAGDFALDGITPMTNPVVKSAAADGDDIVATIFCDPSEWLRQCVELDDDILDSLGQLKGQLPPDEITELVQWLRDSDLNVAIVSGDDGTLSVDSYPTNPDV